MQTDNFYIYLLYWIGYPEWDRVRIFILLAKSWI